jgi:hypothetical protein
VSRSDEQVAFDSWAIAYAGGRIFIGRMMAGKKEDTWLELMPAYELVDLKAPVGAEDGFRMLHMVEIQPIAGCLFDVSVKLELPVPIVIMVEELADGDRNVLKDKIAKLRGRLLEMRVARSGIKLVGADEAPQPKH